MEALNLRQLREKQGLRFRNVVEHEGIDVHYTTVGRWERKGRVPDDYVEALADAYGVPVDELRPPSRQDDEVRYVEGEGDLSVWRSAVAESDMPPMPAAVLGSVGNFVAEGVWVAVVTRQALIDSKDKGLEYVFRLRFP